MLNDLLMVGVFSFLLLLDLLFQESDLFFLSGKGVLLGEVALVGGRALCPQCLDAVGEFDVLEGGDVHFDIEYRMGKGRCTL